MLGITAYSQKNVSDKKSEKKDVQVKYFKKSQIVTTTDPRLLKRRDAQTIKQLDSSQIAETPEAFRKKTGPVLTLKPSAIIENK